MQIRASVQFHGQVITLVRHGYLVYQDSLLQRNNREKVWDQGIFGTGRIVDSYRTP